MSRISISLPDEFMARLEPVKEKINISQVCREALERRIGIFERASGEKGDDLDMEDLISRLREERALVENKWENQGKRNAAAWLATVSYTELRSVVEERGTDHMAKYKLPRAAFRVMKQDMKKVHGGLEGAPALGYKTAWLDYVRSVWAQVKDEVEAAEDLQPVGVVEGDGASPRDA